MRYIKKILHQKYTQSDLTYDEMYTLHNYLKDILEREFNDEYLIITTPTDLSIIDGDEIIITVDATPYTVNELREIINKSFYYDEFV